MQKNLFITSISAFALIVLIFTLTTSSVSAKTEDVVVNYFNISLEEKVTSFCEKSTDNIFVVKDTYKDISYYSVFCTDYNQFLKSVWATQITSVNKNTNTNFDIYRYGFHAFLETNKSGFATGEKTLQVPLLEEWPKGKVVYWIKDFDYKTLWAYLVPKEETSSHLLDFNGFQIPENTAEQYLNLRLLTDVKEMTDAHYNLCGHLAVLFLTDYDLKTFFVDILHKKGGTLNNNLNDGSTTGLDEVLKMASISGFNLESSKQNPRSCQLLYGTDDKTKYDAREIALCQLTNWMTENKGVIAGTFLDKSQGVLVSPNYGYSMQNPKKITEHWFVIIQVLKSLDGEYYVTVYNPYQNREEIYLWQDFYRIWNRNLGFSVNIILSEKKK